MATATSELVYQTGDYKPKPAIHTDAAWKGKTPGPGFVHPNWLLAFAAPDARKAAGLTWGAVLHYLRDAMKLSVALREDVRRILAEVDDAG